MQEYKGLYYNGDVVGEKNRTFRESLKRHRHWLSMRQGFQRVLSNSREQWEMGSRRKDVLPSMGRRKRTADKSLTKNYVSSEKASSELLSAFSILISLLIFSSPSLSTQIPQYLTSVTLLLVSSKFSSHQPFYTTIHLAKSWKILFVLPCTCAQDVNHRWREPRRGSLGSL